MSLQHLLAKLLEFFCISVFAELTKPIVERIGCTAASRSTVLFSTNPTHPYTQQHRRLVPLSSQGRLLLLLLSCRVA